MTGPAASATTEPERVDGAAFGQPTRSKLLEIRGLRHRYESKSGAVEACDIERLVIHAGEFVVLLGPSGCGKSTLLRAIAGLVMPSEGEIMIRGKRIEGPGPDRGLVFQQPALFPWMSVGENVEFGPRVRGMNAEGRDRLAASVLDLVGLRETAKRRTWELSGGMQQRVSVARVLANDPATMLMDEPFSALDELTREQLQEVVVDLWQRTEKTIVFVTHNIDEALRIGTRVIMLSQRPGRAVADLPVPFTHDERKDSVSLRDMDAYRDLRRQLAAKLAG
jgi:taurine transport system ATP-binding protein